MPGSDDAAAAGSAAADAASKRLKQYDAPPGGGRADETTPLMVVNATPAPSYLLNQQNEHPQHHHHHSSLLSDPIPEGHAISTSLPSSQQNGGGDSLTTASDFLAEEDPLMTMPQPPPHRRRRTLSLDFVLEEASEIFASVSEIVNETVEEVTEKFDEVKEEISEIIHEEVAVPVRPREEGDHAQKLSTLALAILVFYKVSGGPFGCEPAVRAAGPGFAILGFMLFPLIWCLQEALVTAELGSAYPEPSGAVAWIEEAFGPKAGLLCGYFHWVSGATDNAIYPSLFLEYLDSYLTSGSGSNEASVLKLPIVRFLFTILMSAGLSFVNWTGLEIVGNLSILVCVVSMSPFVLLCLFGIPKVEPSRWFVGPYGDASPDNLPDELVMASGFIPEFTAYGVLWRPFINNLFWNLNSFDVGASFAGEVKDPERVFPRAMILSIFFVVFSYLLPVVIAIGASDSDQDDWKAGYFTTVAGAIAGPWLAVWTVFAAAISNIALYEAEMSGDAYQLMGMADRGLIPKVFSKRSRFGTPTNGIITGTFIIFCLGVADFDSLVEMLNFAYSVSLLMEFAAFVKLRIIAPEVERPFKLPFNVFGCILFVMPACCVCVFVMITASKVTYIYFMVLTIFGMCFHMLQKTAKHYDWWEYEKPPPSKRSRNNTPSNTPPVGANAKRPESGRSTPVGSGTTTSSQSTTPPVANGGTKNL